jgi:hypothetical protein
MLSNAAAISPTKGRSARALSRLAVLWLAFALLCQGFVVQTHAHFGGDRDGTSVTAPQTIPPAVTVAKKQGPATPACPLCEEQALFGAYLLGSAVTFIAPVAVSHDATATSLPLLARNESSHAWRSRAPPALHA